MRKLLALFLTVSFVAAAQWAPVPTTSYTTLSTILNSKLTFQNGTVAPTALACTAGKDGYIDTVAHNWYVCVATGTPGTWQLIGGGSGITQLTGDVTAGPGTGSQAAVLSTVNSNVGPCGDATHVGQVTLDAKGRATACAAVAISGTSASSPFCSSVITVVGQRITVPPDCRIKVSADTAPVVSPANDYIDVPGGQTGVVIPYFDRGTYYFAHTLTAPTAGAGATLVPATSTIPVGAQAIASFSVSSGVIAAIAPKDGQTQNMITAAGNLQKTVGANGETVLTGTNFETIIGNSTASTETLSSTYCGGTRTFDNSVTLTLPTPGTAGFANGCRVSLISRTTGVITMATSGGSIYPAGTNVIAAGKSAVLKTDGVNYFVETGSGGGSGTTITTYVFTTPGSHNITCGTNGYIDAEGWGGGGSGGGGNFAGGSGGPGGGYGHRFGTCTPAATVVGVVGAGGTWTSGAGGGDGGSTTVAAGATLNVLGGTWPSTSTQLPGYDNTNTPSTRSYFYVEALLTNNDATVRLLPFASVNLSGGTSTFAPGQEDLGGIGTGAVGASTAGPTGSPALSAGAGGGGGANSTTTHAGGAAAKSRYCSSGAGGGVTASVGTAGSAGGAPGCAGGGGSYDGTVRGGGAGGDGKLIVRTW